IYFNSNDASQLRNNSFTYLVKAPLIVVGNGSQRTTLKGGPSVLFFLGGLGYISGNGKFGQTSSWTARLATVLAGSTSVRCINRQDARLFNRGGYALISGVDLQGPASGPPNAYYYEYVYIVDINAKNGVIRLRDPLVNTYKSTWSNYRGAIPGFHPDP